jgi:hypothetical protein
MKSFAICTPHNIEYFSGNEIKEDEKLGHVTHVRERQMQHLYFNKSFGQLRNNLLFMGLKSLLLFSKKACHCTFACTTLI